MSFKNPIALVLLIFAAGSLIYMLLGDGRPPVDADPSGPVPATTKLVVYYFDMGKDCTTCQNLEAFTREALETQFAPDLADGAIVFRAVDVDVPANEHFVEDFKLYTKSVVLVRMEGGAMTGFENLDQIWDLVYDKPGFEEYVRDQIQKFMNASGAAA